MNLWTYKNDAIKYFSNNLMQLDNKFTINQPPINSSAYNLTDKFIIYV